MKTNINILKMFLLSTLVVLFTACGSSNSGDDTVDATIDKIVAYAESGGTPPAPTLQDYIDAGVTGITNVDEINEVVATLTKEDVDTTEKIQALANELGVSVSPTAVIKVTRLSDTEDSAILFSEGQYIRFSAEGSTDPDGSIVSYKWTEGSITLANISVFDKSDLPVGKHVITLTVTDDDGNSASREVTVRVVSTAVINTFESTDVPKAIVGNTITDSIINVSDAVSSISKITVTLDISYHIEHFEAQLISPNGTTVILFPSDLIRHGYEMTMLTLDSTAAEPLDGNVPVPFTGTYRPTGNLADFNIENPNGTWTLRITDAHSGDGTINYWSLYIE